MLQKEQKSSREPRKQDHDTLDKTNLVVTVGARQQQQQEKKEPELKRQQQLSRQEEEEVEELLSLSPQPSIVSTVTHGANNKQHRKLDASRFLQILCGVTLCRLPPENLQAARMPC